MRNLAISMNGISLEIDGNNKFVEYDRAATNGERHTSLNELPKCTLDAINQVISRTVKVFNISL